MKGFFAAIGQSETDAAAGAIYLAVSPDIEKGKKRGSYYCPVGREDETSKLAESVELAKQLWDWTDIKVTEALGQSWKPQLPGYYATQGEVIGAKESNGVPSGTDGRPHSKPKEERPQQQGIAGEPLVAGAAA